MNRDDGAAGDQGGIDPWAPGGVMSDPDGWRLPGDRVAALAGGTRHGVLSNRGRVVISVAGAAVVAVLAAAALGWQTSRDGEPSESAVPAGVRDAVVARTSIGRIEWVRVSGAATSLPASVVAGVDGGLLGRDDDGRLSWVSADGAEWEVDVAAGDVEIAGARWSVDSIGGRRSLVRVVDGGPRVAVPVADDRTAPEGVLVSWEVPGTAARDVLVGVSGGLFARLDRHEEVDWRALLGLTASDEYRVHVVGGEDDETFESAARAAADTIELTAEATAGGVVVRDTGGDVVGTVGVGTAPAGPIDALRPRVTSAWARWDADRFTVLGPPWASDDVVDIAVVADRILAVGTITRHPGGRAWSTADGVHWEPLDLPIEPSETSPMPMAVGRDEIVLSISDGTAPSFWSTRDAAVFERLASVPGINLRSRGSFGWIAPDPRASPLVRVSADGATWTEIDLRDQLGYDAARWDGRLDAIAIGSHIYVTSTVGTERTMLIGEVDTIETSG